MCMCVLGSFKTYTHTNTYMCVPWKMVIWCAEQSKDPGEEASFKYEYISGSHKHRTLALTYTHTK